MDGMQASTRSRPGEATASFSFSYQLAFQQRADCLATLSTGQQGGRTDGSRTQSRQAKRLLHERLAEYEKGLYRA
jgi:hypothetical protein